MQALDHIDIGAANGMERPYLVLAVLECALLMGGKRLAERLCHGPTEFGGRLQRKQSERSIASQCCSASRRAGVSLVIDASFLCAGASDTADVNAANAERFKGCKRFSNGAIDIDATTGILDDHNVKSLPLASSAE
jgi:hypothetical protein